MPSKTDTSSLSGCSQPLRLPGCTEQLSGTFVLTSDAYKHLPRTYTSIEMRCDIDGWYPQHAISCSLLKKRNKGRSHSGVHFVARVRLCEALTWECRVIKTSKGKNPFRPTMILKITVPMAAALDPVADLTVTMRSGIIRTFRFIRSSAYFHPLKVEYDCVAGIRSITALDPASYPIHSPMANSTKVTLRSVLRQTGFKVSISDDHSKVPIRYAGEDNAWSDQELHDAMQVYWSHFFSDQSRWSMWILFANRREKNDSCAGVMFDTSERSQRRGMVVFNDSDYFNGGPDGPNRIAWKNRLRFFTVGHEMGHLFNLSHPGDTRRLWDIPIYESRPTTSFMSNPTLFEKGKDAFFSEFLYRFTDNELMFIRHAPEEYVKMGNRSWIADACLLAPLVHEDGCFSLILRTSRESATFSFMEPVVLECKLKNVSGKEVEINATDYSLTQTMAVWILDAAGKQWRLWRPFLHGEYPSAKQRLHPGVSLFASIFISTDADGWIVIEPGRYSIVACWYFGECQVWSNTISITIDKPISRALEILAQDYFSDEVGRVLAFDGSAVLKKANDCLMKCLEPGIPNEVALHARIALAIPLKKSAKVIDFKKDEHGNVIIAGVATAQPSPEQHRTELAQALFGNPLFAASTLGNIDYKLYVDDFSRWLLKNNLESDACTAQEYLYTTLLQRGVNRESLLLSAIRDNIDAMKLKQTIAI